MSKLYEKLCIGYYNKHSKYCRKCVIPFSCIDIKKKKEMEKEEDKAMSKKDWYR